MPDRNKTDKSRPSIRRRRRRVEEEILRPKFEKEENIYRRIGFRKQFHRFRKSGLGLIDAAFNAFYICICERSIAKEKKKLQKKGTSPVRQVHFWDHHSPALRFFATVLRLIRGVIDGFWRLVRRLWHWEKMGPVRQQGVRFVKKYLVHGIVGVLFLFTAIYITLSLNTPVVLQAEVNGKIVAVVESRHVLDGAVNELEENVEMILGEKFRYPHEITFSFSRQKNSAITEKGKISEELYALIEDYICTASGLYIDNTLIAVCKTPEEIQKELDAFVAKNVGGENTGIINSVQILTQAYPTKSITPGENLPLMLEQMLIPLDQRKKDEPSGIVPLLPKEVTEEARPLAAMPLATDVQAANDKDRIVLAHNPQSFDHILIEFYTARFEEYKATVPYRTVYQESSEHYTTMADEMVRGVNGTSQVRAKVYMVNGKEAKREVISETVLTTPVNRVVSIGTKLLPEDLGITSYEEAPGRFIVPRVGYVSSYWGARDEGFHRGWDIPGNRGDNLYAAAGGVVVVAIDNNRFETATPGHSYEGYGYCVVLQHEDGFSTLYAHCDKIFVTLGQVVSQGEKIAEVGNTGKSTGDHVHFEIMKNGVKQNPKNYLYTGTKTFYDQRNEAFQ